MPKIGIEIIGCGDIARARYFPAIQASPDFELRGVQSRTTAACEPLVARYGGKIFADLGALLNAPEIEAVVVSTPHPSHADISVRCLEGGKHVLCEKPVATSLVDASRILRAAERSGKVFMALPFDRSPPIEAAKQLLAERAIGRVSSADAVLAHRGPKHAPWFFDREKAGWGRFRGPRHLSHQSADLFLRSGAACVRARRNGLSRPEIRCGRNHQGFGRRQRRCDRRMAGFALATIRANWCSASDHRNVICETRIYGTEVIIFINPAAKGARSSCIRRSALSPARQGSNTTACPTATSRPWVRGTATASSCIISPSRSAAATPTRARMPCASGT